MVLEKMNFHPTLISWIMQCITLVSFTFIINGATRGFVKPGRGIRQGDPLSSYLFIICSEVLTGLCTTAQSKGLLKGVSIAIHCPSLNHLMFTEDTIFFCKGKQEKCWNTQVPIGYLWICLWSTHQQTKIIYLLLQEIKCSCSYTNESYSLNRKGRGHGKVPRSPRNLADKRKTHLHLSSIESSSVQRVGHRNSSGVQGRSPCLKMS